MAPTMPKLSPAVPITAKRLLSPCRIPLRAISPRALCQAPGKPTLERLLGRRSFHITAARYRDHRRPFHKTASNRGASPAANSGPGGLLPEFSLEDKVIVVSGGAQGLGVVQAEALLEAGAIVHVLDRQPEPGPESKYRQVARRAAEELNTSLVYHQVDVRESVEDLHRIVREIADRRGRLDGLIAAAGIQQETSALEYAAADADRLLSVNVTGVLMTAQAVARQMVRLQTPGSIALIASMSGTIANRGLICPVYNASKAAVIQLARNLASEWGAHGIRVNTISPGYIVTDMVRALFEKLPDREAEWPRQNMLGKLSAPEDYRGAAVFLLSDASRFMTGADLRIDGGHAAW